MPWLLAAAAQGHPGAAYLCGELLHPAEGSLGWFFLAAERGHRGARARVLHILDESERCDGRETTGSSASGEYGVVAGRRPSKWAGVTGGTK